MTFEIFQYILFFKLFIENLVMTVCRLLLEKVALLGLGYFYLVFFNRIRQKSLVNVIDRVAGFLILAKKRMNLTSNTKNSKTLIMFDNRKSRLHCRAIYLCKFLLQNLFLMLNNKLISQTENTELREFFVQI